MQMESLERHRVHAIAPDSVRIGTVRYAPAKSTWFLGMALGALIGGPLTFTWTAFGLFLAITLAAHQALDAPASAWRARQAGYQAGPISNGSKIRATSVQ